MAAQRTRAAAHSARIYHLNNIRATRLGNRINVQVVGQRGMFKIFFGASKAAPAAAAVASKVAAGAAVVGTAVYNWSESQKKNIQWIAEVLRKEMQRSGDLGDLATNMNIPARIRDNLDSPELKFVLESLAKEKADRVASLGVSSAAKSIGTAYLNSASTTVTPAAQAAATAATTATATVTESAAKTALKMPAQELKYSFGNPVKKLKDTVPAAKLAEVGVRVVIAGVKASSNKEVKSGADAAAFVVKDVAGGMVESAATSYMAAGIKAGTTIVAKSWGLAIPAGKLGVVTTSAGSIGAVVLAGVVVYKVKGKISRKRAEWAAQRLLEEQMVRAAQQEAAKKAAEEAAKKAAEEAAKKGFIERTTEAIKNNPGKAAVGAVAAVAAGYVIVNKVIPAVHQAMSTQGAGSGSTTSSSSSSRNDGSTTYDAIRSGQASPYTQATPQAEVKATAAESAESAHKLNDEEQNLEQRSNNTGQRASSADAGSNATVAGGGAPQDPRENKDEKNKKKEVEWTDHGRKHVPPKRINWKEIIKSTLHGDAKYTIGLNIQKIEKYVWEYGLPCKDNLWRVMQFEEVIGAYEGAETTCMVVKNSANTIHGHPISHAEMLRLLKK